MRFFCAKRAAKNNECNYAVMSRLRNKRSIMQQAIIGFHQDEKGDWVARLACRHQQHMRHNPPWIIKRN